MARLSRTGKKTGKAKARKASLATGRKAKTAKAGKTTAKRKIAAAARKRQPASVLADELKEAREQQAATAEILKVINASKGDPAPVFDAILEKTHSLCDLASGSLQLYEGGRVQTVAMRGYNDRWKDYLREGIKIDDTNRPSYESPVSRQIVDVRKLLEDTPSPIWRAFVEVGGFRTFLGLPLVKDGKAIGRIIAARYEVRPFTDRQIALLQGFADQAVIAIENTRQFNETQQALERQTATAEILKVIAGSPSDVQPVFDAIAASARRVVKGFSAVVTRVVGEEIHLAAFTAGSDAGRLALTQMYPQPLSSSLAAAQVVRTGQLFLQSDTEADTGVTKELARARGFRSLLSVPMLHDGKAIGTINVTRAEPGGFAEGAISLMQTFAAQAVIAIENTRLFNETQEALERQTATADILKVIASSPDDVQPVFETVAERAMALLGAWSAIVLPYDGEYLHFGAARGALPDTEDFIRRLYPARPSPEISHGRAIIERTVINTPDFQEDPSPRNRERARERGFRAGVTVPMLREGVPIGVIAVARQQAGAFTAKEIALLQTFADQAVIAVENARLFEEVQSRTRDLTEALAYQTGSSNVLRVIASSPTDIDPVLLAIVESARELCEADDAAVLLRDGESLRFREHSGPIPIRHDRWPIGRNWTAGRAFVDQKPVHVRDMLSEEGAEFPDARAMGQSTGANIRTVLSVPLLRGAESIGAILLRRAEVRPFQDKQIELLSTFADQAVIAIENARLFNETREALEQQKASADILSVISKSVANPAPVFDKILDACGRIFNGVDMMVFLVEDDQTLTLGAIRGSDPERVERVRLPPAAGDWHGDRTRHSRAQADNIRRRVQRPRRSRRTSARRSRSGRDLCGRDRAHALEGPRHRRHYRFEILAAQTVRCSRTTVAADFRRSSRDRDPKRQPVQRGSGSHPRPL